MSTTTISIRLDKNVKKNAEELFDDLGINMSTAINIFLRQAIRKRKIPFEIESGAVPNEETIAAMKETEKMRHDPTEKTYYNLEELFSDMDKEVALDD